MAGDDCRFVSWSRRAGLSIRSTDSGRPALTIDLKATDDRGNTADAHPEVLFHGPGDVVGLSPHAIAGQWPSRGQADAERYFCPYVEFHATDLPWRYSPRGLQDGMPPWLALLVAAPGEVIHLGAGTVTLDATALAAHPFDDVNGAAHVQHTRAAAYATSSLSRVLCLRPLYVPPLDEARELLAVLVPVFDQDGAPRWDGGEATTLPVLHHWWFRVADGGTFRDLAEKLRPADDLADFGTIRVKLGDGEHEHVDVRGALTGIEQHADPPPHQAAQDRLERLHDIPTEDDAGRPWVKPPIYGESWRTDIDEGAPAGGWVDQLAVDPTHRVVAGLGVKAGVDLQDEIAAGAAARAGALAPANQRIAALVLGLLAGTSTWDRRLPDQRDQRLALLGLAASRILTTTDGETGAGKALLDRATGPGRTLPPALFSSAARRLLRPGAARLRHAGASATEIHTVANTVRPAVRRPDDAPGDAHYAEGVAHADALARTLGLTGDQLTADLSSDQPPAIATALERLREPPEREPPTEANLDELERALRYALGPPGVAYTRVLNSIEPPAPQGAAPREPCLPLDLPAWRYLRDRAREWLLPGARSLQEGEVVALASNPVFVDAFLVGLNTQALSELRWRNIKVASGCTPLRYFWDRRTRGPDDDAFGDITGIQHWAGSGASSPDPRSLPLGHRDHAPQAWNSDVHRAQLVVAFCTDLFRRYPGTLVYLGRSFGGWTTADLADDHRVPPTFAAEVTPDLRLFAFDIPPDQIADHWVVIEQAPPGIRFDRRDDVGGTSADRAAAMLEQPVRVLLAGPSLVGGA